MERIILNSNKLLNFIESFNPNNSGIFFSITLHLLILLFAVGLPNFFNPKDINVSNIVPIEILNVTQETNIIKNRIDSKSNESKKTVSKQKKFNSSDNLEVQKKVELKENKKVLVKKNDDRSIELKTNKEIVIDEKKNIQIKKKENNNLEKIFETIKIDEIKPKIKPKTKENNVNNKSDLQIESKNEVVKKPIKNDIITKPKAKPEEDFSIASMLKDLRNEKTNNIKDNEIVDSKEDNFSESEKNENMILSISEIDLLRQQLSSCWNAPAGAIIERGMKVTVSAKVQQNMRVLTNSVRIVDTNISKSNPFYGPITDSAMRTLLNPECTPLKLPEEKYSLWKNLTITFDYSIMKGY